ncbi:MAG: hypothetical protein PHI42_06350 [Paludibacteraceae bacterium]|nr:hypothetical protein [Paludibacteraceae bacterium]
METTVKQRLIEFLTYKKIGQKKFAETCGLSSGYVNAIRKSIQPDKINRIAMQFPDLNTGWLLTGNGEMLNVDTEKVAHNNDATCLQCAIKDAEIARLKDKIIELQERLLNGVEPKKARNAG